MQIGLVICHLRNHIVSVFLKDFILCMRVTPLHDVCGIKARTDVVRTE